MSVSVSFFAFESGDAVPAASGTGVFLSGLLRLLREARPPLDLRVRWLRPARGRGAWQFSRWRLASRWMAGELWRMVWDRSRYLVFVYPKLPVLAHVEQPTMLSAARLAFRALAAKTRATRQRIIVIVEDLPVEMWEGREAAGVKMPKPDVNAIRGIEATLFRAAHRMIVPTGFLDPIRERYAIDSTTFRSFRRNIYPPIPVPDEVDGIDFEKAKVNFFYSGSIDSHVAPNFREILRAIRNAPDARLHVCGPGVEAVREWLSELDVPNVTHYGQLGRKEHDWLARRCDIGLILYPSDNPYNHLTPTMKYSAYLANGLAVLSTQLDRVVENVRSDGVGQAMPIRELCVELLRWATRPALWTECKTSAERQAAAIQSGEEMKGWVEEIAHGG